MSSISDDNRYLIQLKNSLFTVLKDKHINATSKKFILKSVSRNKRVALPVKFESENVYGVAILGTSSHNQMMNHPLYKSFLITPRKQLKTSDFYDVVEIKSICQNIYNPDDFSDDSSTDQDDITEVYSSRKVLKQKRYSGTTSKTELDFQASQGETDAFTRHVEEITLQKYTAYDKFEQHRTFLEEHKTDMLKLIENGQSEQIDICLVAKYAYMSYVYSQMCCNLLKTYPGGYKFNEIPPYRIVGEFMLIDNKWPVDFQIVTSAVKKAKTFEEHFRDMCYLSFKHSELKNTSMTGKSKPSSGGERKDLVKINERKITLVYKTAADIYSLHQDLDAAEDIRRANTCARMKDMQKNIREFLNYNREPSKHTKEELDLREKYPNYPVFYTRNSIMSVIENPPFWLKVYLEDTSIIDLLQENANRNQKYAEYVKAYEINAEDPFLGGEMSSRDTIDQSDVPTEEDDFLLGGDSADIAEKPDENQQAEDADKEKRATRKGKGQKRPTNTATQVISSKNRKK